MNTSAFSPLSCVELPRKTMAVAVRPVQGSRLSVWAALVHKEVRDALRNRWFLFYTGAFALLTPALAYLAHAGSGMAGFGGFGATAASLVNLVMLMLPLMALTVGAQSLAGDRERGFLAYLLAQPVTPAEVFFGRFVGLALCLGASLALGFGLGAVVLALQGGAAEAPVFLRLVALSGLLAMAMLAVGMLISALARRSGSALGAAILLWLVLVFFGDLGLMGASVIFRLRIETLFFAALANPLECFRLGVVAGFDPSLDVLGPAGLYATDALGGWLSPVLLAALVAWFAGALTAAAAIFNRRPL